MDPDGSQVVSGLVQRHGSHPAAIQCWTIGMRSERARITRIYQAKQSPEPWSVADHWTAKSLCHQRPVNLYEVQAEIFASNHQMVA